MSRAPWQDRERALQALSRASVEASRCCLVGDVLGLARWVLAEDAALAALDGLDPPDGRVVARLDAFPDACPLFPGPRA